MLVTIAGLVIVLAAAFFVAWPLLSDARTARTPDAGSTIGQGDPEHEKELALRAIREADFDHRTGKLSDEDHAVLRQELEERALRALSALDEASALRPVAPAAPPATAGVAQPRAAGEPGGFCPSCGVRFARGARFCPGCGKKLPAAKERGRRRA
jgi:cytochrome c-type biogenesis protein CcmI